MCYHGAKMGKVVGRQREKKDQIDQQMAKELKQVERSLDYIATTSVPGLSWRQLLGRPNEAHD